MRVKLHLYVSSQMYAIIIISASFANRHTKMVMTKYIRKLNSFLSPIRK
jgi:hypothetical protein